MNYQTVLVEKEGGIATITLNRPDRLNALTPQMRVEMKAALEDADADTGIRVIIITGAGRAFCSGAEVANVLEESESGKEDLERERLMKPSRALLSLTLMRSLKKPTICALNGAAVGAGAAIVMACDIIIASEQGKLRIGFTRMGVVPAGGLSSVLPKRIGTHRALELAYTNDLVDAKELDRIGLVNKVVPAGELMTAAKEMAKKMFQIPPLSLALTKKCMYQGVDAADVEIHGNIERFAEWTLQGTEDTKEAQKSFVEKREPVYKGK